MNLLTRIRDRLAPRARRVAPPAGGLASAVVPLSGKSPRTLTWTDFAAQAQVIGVRSIVAAHRVPRGDVAELTVDAPLRLYLRARWDTEGDTGAGTTLDLDLGAAGFTMVRSTRDAPAAPFTLGHPDFTVYVREEFTPNFLPAEVTAVDFDAGTFTVSGLTLGTNYEVRAYYLPGDGALHIRAIQPSGIDGRSVELYNATLRGLHETDQANGRTAPYIHRAGLSGLPLGPKWTLALEVDSPAPIPWTAEAGHEVALRGHRASVATLNERQLSAAVGGTLLNR